MRTYPAEPRATIPARQRENAVIKDAFQDLLTDLGGPVVAFPIDLETLENHLKKHSSSHAERLIRGKNFGDKYIEIALSQVNKEADSWKLSFIASNSQPMKVSKQYGPLKIKYAGTDGSMKFIELQTGREGQAPGRR